jgi:hypothetical protein
MLDGLANVLLPPRVTEKLLESFMSGVIVAPSLSAVISPRCPDVNVCAASVTALSASNACTFVPIARPRLVLDVPAFATSDRLLAAVNSPDADTAATCQAEPL